jgi:hypothetical protein
MILTRSQIDSATIMMIMKLVSPNYSLYATSFTGDKASIWNGVVNTCKMLSSVPSGY